MLSPLLCALTAAAAAAHPTTPTAAAHLLGAVAHAPSNPQKLDVVLEIFSILGLEVGAGSRA